MLRLFFALTLCALWAASQPAQAQGRTAAAPAA